MSVRSWQPIQVASPRGTWSVVGEKRRGKPARASLMQNCRINPGVVVTRPGTSVIAGADGTITGLYNWITPAGANYVLYQDGTEIRSLNQDTSAVVDQLNGVTSIAPVFADVDVWTYFCGYRSDGSGDFAVHVFDGTNADAAFRNPPVLTAATAVDGGVGNSTEGTHYIGFVYQNRSGFQGKPSIDVASVPISVTLNAGLRQIDISVTLPALDDGGSGATLFLIMTTAANSAKFFFIPTDTPTGSIGSRPVPLNTITTLTFVANFSDEDIPGLESAENNFLWQTVENGTNPPSFVSVYGQRMCYGVGSNLYVSQVGQPQQFTVDQNTVSMPNKRVIGMAFQLPNSPDLYLTGDRWTARTTDNGDLPVTWAAPVEVSGALGAPFPGCVCYRTGGNHAWIVTERGIDIFNGAYGALPLTYMVSNQWSRVNWNAAYAIETADDITNLRFYCAVPLDGATTPTHIFVVDYTNGMTFDTCDISLDVFIQGAFSSIGVVKEVADGLTNLWIAIGGNIVHFDSTTKNDQGYAINSYWESGLVRGTQIPSKMIKVGAADIWVRGAGTLAQTWYGPDRVVSTSPALLSTQGVATTLAANPGITYMAKGFLSKIEDVTCRFGTNEVDGYFSLSSFTLYVKKDLYNR